MSTPSPYRNPLPVTANGFYLRLGLQSTTHYNKTSNVPGVLLPHIEKLISGRVEGIAILSRVPPNLHQAVTEAVQAAVKAYYATSATSSSGSRGIGVVDPDKSEA
jgi:hypothetical protein